MNVRSCPASLPELKTSDRKEGEDVAHVLTCRQQSPVNRGRGGAKPKCERKSKDRPTRAPNVVFVVASHYQSLQIIVLLLQACLLEIYLFCRI